MPDPEPSLRRYRFVRPIVIGLVCVVGLGILWMQLGVEIFWLGFLSIVAGTAVSVVRKATAPSLSEDSEDMSTRHERVLSPIPIEAAKARVRLVLQFLGGLLYLAFVSVLLTGLTGAPFLIVFGAVTSGIIFTGAMILVWAASWALRDDTRRYQFSISTLLFLMTILAVYLGAIRMLADLSGDRLGLGDNPFLEAAVICSIMSGVSLLFLVYFMESLVWLATWFVRRSWVQRWLRR